MNVEDILRAHGIGVGSGTKIVKSSTQPTTGLSEGMFWFNTANNQLKMYVNGSFQSLGGGAMVTSFTNRVTVVAATSSATIGIPQYNRTTDILMVFQGGTKINQGTEYTISTDGTSIQTVSGTWAAGVILDFVVIATTVAPSTDTLNLMVLSSNATVATNGTTNVVFNIPAYNSTTDILEVYQEETRIHKGTHWNLNANAQSIDLIGYTANAGDNFYFYVYKKIRDTVPAGTVDASNLLDGSVTLTKLSPDIQSLIGGSRTNLITSTNNLLGM